MFGPVDVVGSLKEIGERSWRWLVGWGVAAVLLGAVVLTWPGRTTVVVGILFGLYLLATGAMSVLVGLTVPLTTGIRVLTLISGVLSVVLGVVCFRDEWQSVLLLGLWIGIGWLVAGASRLAAGLTVAMPGRGWALVDGVLLFLGGVALIAYPQPSLVTLAMMAGAFLVAVGVIEVLHGVTMRSALRRV